MLGLGAAATALFVAAFSGDQRAKFNRLNPFPWAEEERPIRWPGDRSLRELAGKPSFWAMAIGAALTALVGYGLAGFQATEVPRGQARLLGKIQWLESTGHADYAAISSGLNKRYANNWQAGLTYTYMLFMHDDTTNFQYEGNNPFDPDAEWARSQEFQRHTLRFNAIYRLPWDINLSGAYFFGSGNYYQTTIAATPFGSVGNNRYVTTAVTVPADVADRFDGPTSFAVGDVIPRNALKGDPLHRVDFRVAKDIPLPSGMKLGLIAGNPFDVGRRLFATGLPTRVPKLLQTHGGRLLAVLCIDDDISERTLGTVSRNRRHRDPETALSHAGMLKNGFLLRHRQLPAGPQSPAGWSFIWRCSLSSSNIRVTSLSSSSAKRTTAAARRRSRR